MPQIEDVAQCARCVYMGCAPYSDRAMETVRGRQLERLKLRLVEASCSSCVPAIRRELERVRGIEWVGVNPVLDLIFVDYDPSLINMEEILLAVERSGYKAIRVST